MKISKQQLKRLIKEELMEALGGPLLHADPEICLPGTGGSTGIPCEIVSPTPTPGRSQEERGEEEAEADLRRRSGAYQEEYGPGLAGMPGVKPEFGVSGTLPDPQTEPGTAGEYLSQAIFHDADEWVGYTHREVKDALREMGVNPVHGWWAGEGRRGRLKGRAYPKSHPARIKYRVWYQWRREGGKPSGSGTRAAERILEPIRSSEMMKEGLKKPITSSSLKKLIRQVLKTDYQ